MRGVVQTKQRADAHRAAERLDRGVGNHVAEFRTRLVGQPGLDGPGGRGTVAEDDERVLGVAPAALDLADEPLLPPDQLLQRLGPVGPAQLPLPGVGPDERERGPKPVRMVYSTSSLPGCFLKVPREAVPPGGQVTVPVVLAGRSKGPKTVVFDVSTDAPTQHSFRVEARFTASTMTDGYLALAVPLQ